MIDMLPIICNKIWQTGEWPIPCTQSLIITLPKKANLQLCQKYRTISLISHPSKVMLIIVVFLSCPLVKKHADLSGSFLYSQSTMKNMYSKPTNRTKLSIPMKTKSIA